MELGHSQIQIVNSFARVCMCVCVCILYTDVKIKCTLVADMFAIYNLWPLCASLSDAAFLRSVFPGRSGATFQGWPLATWGPRQGQRGSNAGIVLRAQHAFSLLRLRDAALPNSPSFLRGELARRLHLYLSCMCTRGRVEGGADIILRRACARMWSPRCGFCKTPLSLTWLGR